MLRYWGNLEFSELRLFKSKLSRRYESSRQAAEHWRRTQKNNYVSHYYIHAHAEKEGIYEACHIIDGVVVMWLKHFDDPKVAFGVAYQKAKDELTARGLPQGDARVMFPESIDGNPVVI